MVTKLIVARHGNTFNKGDIITRVGGKTDLPLVESGLKQGELLGKYLKQEEIFPDVIYSSPLKRAKQTAQKAIEFMGIEREIKESDDFSEIDYGQDENRPEEEVVARVGQDAIDLWNTEAIPPAGWNVNPQEIRQSWKDFADSIKDSGQTVMVTTSNGIARFSFAILQDESIVKDLDIKLSTGAFGIFIYENGEWKMDSWNVKPKNFVE